MATIQYELHVGVDIASKQVMFKLPGEQPQTIEITLKTEPLSDDLMTLACYGAAIKHILNHCEFKPETTKLVLYIKRPVERQTLACIASKARGQSPHAKTCRAVFDMLRLFKSLSFTTPKA